VFRKGCPKSVLVKYLTTVYYYGTPVNKFTNPLPGGLVENSNTTNKKGLGLIAIGKAIRVVREARNQRLGEVAKNAGVSVPFLSLVENGERGPSLDVVVRLSMALKLPVDVLLLLTQSGKTTLKTSDRRTMGLVKAIQAVDEAEKKLRSKLESIA
jgi:transcriptional regulator with XRE-family HTH domain